MISIRCIDTSRLKHQKESRLVKFSAYFFMLKKFFLSNSNFIVIFYVLCFAANCNISDLYLFFCLGLLSVIVTGISNKMILHYLFSGEKVSDVSYEFWKIVLLIVLITALGVHFFRSSEGNETFFLLVIFFLVFLLDKNEFEFFAKLRKLYINYFFLDADEIDRVQLSDGKVFTRMDVFMDKGFVLRFKLFKHNSGKVAQKLQHFEIKVNAIA